MGIPENYPAGPPQQAAPERPGWIGPYRLANLGWRLLSGLIDYAPAIALTIVFSFLGRSTHTASAQCPPDSGASICYSASTSGGLLWVGAVLGLAWGLFTSVWLQGRTGQSIGKRVLGLQLARPVYLDGKGNTLVVPGRGLCLGRYFAHILDGIPFYAGYWLAPLVSRRRQTFADMICGTVVLAPRAHNGALLPLDQGTGPRA